MICTGFFYDANNKDVSYVMYENGDAYKIDSKLKNMEKISHERFKEEWDNFSKRYDEYKLKGNSFTANLKKMYENTI